MIPSRMVPALLLALLLGFATGCPGHLDDPSRFVDAGGSGGDDAAKGTTDDAGADDAASEDATADDAGEDAAAE